MLKFLNHKRYKYFIMLPVVFLLLSALYYKYEIKEIQGALLLENYNKAVNYVDVLASAVEANKERKWLDHEQNICDAVEFIDQLYQMYGAAYKLVDGQLLLITERFYETSPFELLDFTEFCDTVFGQESGGLIIGYAPESQAYRALHIYFQWMPLYSPENERYLVVAGASAYSVTSTIPLWVSAWQWVSMGITFILNVCLIMLLARLGHIYEQRGGDVYREGRQ